MAWRHVPVAINTLAAWMFTTYELAVKSPFPSIISHCSVVLLWKIIIGMNYIPLTQALCGKPQVHCFLFHFQWPTSRVRPEASWSFSKTLLWLRVVWHIQVRLWVTVVRIDPARSPSGPEQTGIQVWPSLPSRWISPVHSVSAGSRTVLQYLVVSSRGYTLIHFLSVLSSTISMQPLEAA